MLAHSPPVESALRARGSHRTNEATNYLWRERHHLVHAASATTVRSSHWQRRRSRDLNDSFRPSLGAFVKNKYRTSIWIRLRRPTATFNHSWTNLAPLLFVVVAGCGIDDRVIEEPDGNDGARSAEASIEGSLPERLIPGSDARALGETTTDGDAARLDDKSSPASDVDAFADAQVDAVRKDDGSTAIDAACASRNLCGGCDPLPAKPGDLCGHCGTYACAPGQAGLTCIDPGVNACGGCGTITTPPGASCGSCGSYVCSADKTTTVCSGANANACGGCGTLIAAPNTPCGKCGEYTCSADKSQVSCVDPGVNACGACGTLAASPGSACGACGKYQCTADKTSVSCSDPGRNACLGCGALVAAPTAPCGSCGRYVCNAAGSAVSCSDPGLNACGTCGALPTAFGTRCGSCGGTIQCDSTCSVADPPTLNQACGCGGTIACSGACNQSGCNRITFDIVTGADDLRQDSSATATIVIAGIAQTFTLKAQNAAAWGNGSDNVVAITVPAQPSSAFGPITITLTSHNGAFETDDNWNVQSVRATLSNGTTSPCLVFGSGNPLKRLTGSDGSLSLAPGGC